MHNQKKQKSQMVLPGDLFNCDLLEPSKRSLTLKKQYY
jgi:hypothetical protein